VLDDRSGGTEKTRATSKLVLDGLRGRKCEESAGQRTERSKENGEADGNGCVKQDISESL